MNRNAKGGKKRSTMRFHRLNLRLLAVAAFATVVVSSSSASVRAAGSATRTVAVSDSNWFFSPCNWHANGSAFAESQNPGAYFAIGFTGSQASLTLDVSMLDHVSAASWPRIRWQIDENTPEDHRLKQGDSLLPLDSNDLSTGAHSLRVWLIANEIFVDRWLVPVENFRVTGLVIDADGATFAPSLRPQRILFFGDSISEGLDTESGSGKYINDSDATHAFTYACGAALDAEFGVVAFAGQGWNIALLSNAPPFSASWSEQFDGQPRSFSPAPDSVVVMMGGNDALFGDLGGVAAAVTTWLGDVRATLPGTKIFFVVEFGGYARDEVSRGFEDYQAAAHDENAHLIDLGAAAEVGLDAGFVKGGTAQSYDGPHPTAGRAAELGAMLAGAIQAVLDGE
jgi:lysophospholipase L1-like esterase